MEFNVVRLDHSAGVECKVKTRLILAKRTINDASRRRSMVEWAFEALLVLNLDVFYVHHLS